MNAWTSGNLRVLAASADASIWSYVMPADHELSDLLKTTYWDGSPLPVGAQVSAVKRGRGKLVMFARFLVTYVKMNRVDAVLLDAWPGGADAEEVVDNEPVRDLEIVRAAPWHSATVVRGLPPGKYRVNGGAVVRLNEGDTYHVPLIFNMEDPS